MKIKLNEISIKDLFNGYSNNGEEGVYAYSGKLNVRPKYQREYIYEPENRNAVIQTLLQNFPLNVMYWAKNHDGTYEIIDGQQRTISICMFLNNEFSINEKYFHSLSEKEKNLIENYKLQVYICEGDEQEKLDWFKTINIAAKPLYEQELRNAIYSGSFVTDAKRMFSKNSSEILKEWGSYIDGNTIRQDVLQRVLDWVSKNKNISINEYMSKHQFENDAKNLENEFTKIMKWVKKNFVVYRNEMNKVEWGHLYYQHKDDVLDPDEIEKDVKNLFEDFYIKRKKGIYEYILNNDERALNLRTFDDKTKATVYERQDHKCAICNKEFERNKMHADHITPWSDGGSTDIDNCQMLCIDCNLKKSNK